MIDNPCVSSLKNPGLPPVTLVAIVMGVVAASVLCVATTAGEPQTTRWTAEQIARIRVNDWVQAQKDIAAEKRTLVRAWLKIASNPKQSNGGRIQAILFAARMETKPAIEYCLENLKLFVLMPGGRQDDDEEKSRPCLYALRHMSWAAVPHILKFLTRAPLNPAAAREFAGVLDQICSRALAVSLLEGVQKANKSRNATDNASAILKSLKRE